MALYEYTALSEKGKKFSSTIHADSLKEAKLKLIQLNIAALSISSIKTPPSKEHLSTRECLNLTKELSRLLSASLPLFEALEALEEKYRGQKPHKILLDLTDMVKGGLAFSEALSCHEKTFDLLYVSMVANGEKTGRLIQALDELSELMTRQLEIKKQLLAALLYPALLSSFCLVVLSSLLFYVIPSLKELFDGRDLHPFTQIVFTASSIACSLKPYLLIAGLAGICLLIASHFISSWKKRIFSLFSQLPWIRTVLAKTALVRFSRALATLLEGGVPIVEAFAQARRVMGHPLLEEVILEAEHKIREGEAISAPFRNNPLIPPMIPRLIAIAEEGGKLPVMMKQIAEIYEEELEKTLTHFATIAQPALLLILGIVIGFVLLSVLLPLTDVSSFVT